MSLPGLDDVVAVVRAHAADADRDAMFPVESLAVLRESGLLGMFVPVELGGIGTDLRSYVDTAQALSAACATTGMVWVMHALQVDAVVRHGSEQLRTGLIPRITAGDLYIASVTTEAESGPDLFTAHAPLHNKNGFEEFERTAPVVTGG